MATSGKWWIKYRIVKLIPKGNGFTNGKATETGRLEADTFDELQRRLKGVYDTKVRGKLLSLDHGGFANAPSGRRRDRRRISAG